LTIAAAASGKLRASGLTAAPSFAQIALVCVRSVISVLICFPFLIMIGCFAILNS
jgi:hypothetical protein